MKKYTWWVKIRTIIKEKYRMINSYRDIRSIAIINVNETIKDNIQRFRKAYRYIADLSLYAKEEGLLFLDSHMDFIEDEDPMTENLIWMVDMIVDSLEPDCLEVIVTNRFLVRNYKGIDALIYYVYAMGIIYIQRGVNPLVIEEFFNSFIPEEFIPGDSISHKYFDYIETKTMRKNSEKIERIKELLTAEETEYVGKVRTSLLSLSNDEWGLITAEAGFDEWGVFIPIFDMETRILIDLQMAPGRVRRYMWDVHMPKDGEIEKCCDMYFSVLNEIREENSKRVNLDDGILEILEMDKSDIGIAIKEEYYSSVKSYIPVALKGVSEPIVNRLLDTIDKRTAMYIRDEIEFMGPVRVTDIEKAQKELMANVLGLQVARAIENKR